MNLLMRDIDIQVHDAGGGNGRDNDAVAISEDG
jgi:hypothetical protein